jgi:hypothetical protein
MRARTALVAALALTAAFALGGCMSRPGSHDRSGEVSYNRRDLPPNEPGLVTGPDGVWTVYRNDAPEEPPPPRKRTVLMGEGVDSPDPER